MPRPSFTIPKKTAARELRLSEQFTPERNGDDDRSRDRTPGSEVQPEPQPEPQHQSQQWPRAMHLGASPDDPHQRFQLPQYPQQQQQQWQHQMMQNQMMQQQMQQHQAQQQFGGWNGGTGSYNPANFGFGPQHGSQFGGPPQMQMFQPQPQQSPPPPQQQQQHQQQQAAGDALSTSERPFNPTAPSRRPQAGSPGGSGKQQKTTLEAMTRPRALR